MLKKGKQIQGAQGGGQSSGTKTTPGMGAKGGGMSGSSNCGSKPARPA